MPTSSEVSIVIPVFNCETFLKQAIDSALGQGQVIVVNDGSTDGTSAIMDGFGSSIEAIHLKKNGGTARALNEGIKANKANWIKWLSADDVLIPSAFSEMLKTVEQVPDNKQVIFYTNYHVVDKHGKNIRTVKEPDNSKHQNAVLLDHFYGNGSTSLIHKAVFERCGNFDETQRYQEDYEFWLRACLLYGIRLKLIDTYSILYREHDQQLTCQKKGQSLQQSIEIREKILTLAPECRALIGTYKPSLKIRLKRKAQNWLYS